MRVTLFPSTLVSTHGRKVQNVLASVRFGSEKTPTVPDSKELSAEQEQQADVDQRVMEVCAHEMGHDLAGEIALSALGIRCKPYDDSMGINSDGSGYSNFKFVPPLSGRKKFERALATRTAAGIVMEEKLLGRISDGYVADEACLEDRIASLVYLENKPGAWIPDERRAFFNREVYRAIATAEAIFNTLELNKLQAACQRLFDDVKRGKTVWSRDELDAYYAQLGLLEKKPR
jgi:hypothetical protein